MIHLADVSKTYTTANGPVHALASVDLDVAKGEFVAVRGPSGCGKSTLLMIVGALGSPTSGSVTVGDEDLLAMSAAARARFRARRIGFVFQMFHLLPYLTVLENVAAAALPGQRPPRRTGPENCSGSFISPTAPAIDRPNSPPASASAWPSPGRWSIGRS